MNSELLERSNNQCELCASKKELESYSVDKNEEEILDNQVLLCSKCREELEDPTTMDVNHWRALNDSMWSEHRAVQVMAYRALKLLQGETWAQDLAEQMYLDEEARETALSSISGPNEPVGSMHKDSNGTQLLEGDSVTLIKDLVVKGANFTAKRGTMVRNITLSTNPLHIEGRVNGTKIVLVTKYLKRVNS